MTQIRWAGFVGVGALLLVAGLAAGLFRPQATPGARDGVQPGGARPQPGLAPAAVRSDEKVLRDQVAAFEAAFNKGDLDGLMASWSDDAEFIAEDGQVTRGKDGIRALLGKGLQAYKGHKQSIRVGSIRFIRPDVACEDGTVTLTSPEGVPETGRYDVLWVKQEGKWRMARLRDLPGVASAEPTAVGRLKQLSWLVGEWVDRESKGKVRLSCRWAAERTFLIQEFTVKQAGGKDLVLTQYVGYDPASEQLRSWLFDSSGGFSGAWWTREGNTWSAASEGVLPDGQAATAVTRVQYMDDNQFLYTSKDRQVEEQPLPDLSITFVRQTKDR